MIVVFQCISALQFLAMTGTMHSILQEAYPKNENYGYSGKLDGIFHFLTNEWKTFYRTVWHKLNARNNGLSLTFLLWNHIVSSHFLMNHFCLCEQKYAPRTHTSKPFSSSVRAIFCFRSADHRSRYFPFSRKKKYWIEAKFTHSASTSNHHHWLWQFVNSWSKEFSEYTQQTQA